MKNEKMITKMDFDRLENALRHPQPKVTKDKERLEQQQQRLCGTCKICGEPMTYITGNVLVCTNPSCGGVTRNEGTEYEEHESYYRLLDAKGAKIAENIFS